MFGKEKREAEDQRDAAIAIAYHLILLANNGEKMLERLNGLVQYALDRNGEQYSYENTMYVRDRILDRLEKMKGDKSFMQHGLDYKTADQDEIDMAILTASKANRVPKTWEQARDDYFHKLSGGYKDKEATWREDFKTQFGCEFD